MEGMQKRTTLMKRSNGRKEGGGNWNRRKEERKFGTGGRNNGMEGYKRYEDIKEERKGK